MWLNIIREMLRNIESCPSGTCSACNKSIDAARDALNELDKIKDEELTDKEMDKFNCLVDDMCDKYTWKELEYISKTLNNERNKI